MLIYFRLSPQDPDNGVNVWPLLLFTGADEFSNFPSVQECDRQVSGLMRTACLTPSSKSKDLDDLLETKGPWPQFAEGSLILWRKPAPLSELEEEDNQELASGEQPPIRPPSLTRADIYSDKARHGPFVMNLEVDLKYVKQHRKLLLIRMYLTCVVFT